MRRLTCLVPQVTPFSCRASPVLGIVVSSYDHVHTATLEELDAATDKHNIFIDMAKFVTSCCRLFKVRDDGEAQPSAGLEEQKTEQDIEVDLPDLSETLSQPPAAKAPAAYIDPPVRTPADDPKSSGCLELWTEEPAERMTNKNGTTIKRQQQGEDVVGHVLSLTRAVELLSLQMHTVQTQMAELNKKLDRSLNSREA